MRTRPNMKMLACLGTYFALLAYEVAFDKHCAAFQLARASSSAGLFKSTSGEIDREKEKRDESNGTGRMWREKRRKQVATFVSSFFHPLLVSFSFSLSLSLSLSLFLFFFLLSCLCFLETRRIYKRWKDERDWTRAITLNRNDARECLILFPLLERKMKYSWRRSSVYVRLGYSERTVNLKPETDFRNELARKT